MGAAVERTHVAAAVEVEQDVAGGVGGAEIVQHCGRDVVGAWQGDGAVRGACFCAEDVDCFRGGC